MMAERTPQRAQSLDNESKIDIISSLSPLILANCIQRMVPVMQKKENCVPSVLLIQKRITSPTSSRIYLQQSVI